LIAVGGAFLSTAVAFSFARGIFHPYYVSLLAPFTAALVGAGAGLLLDARGARLLAPLAIGAGVIIELVVLGELGGQLAWARWVIVVGAGSAAVLALRLSPRMRAMFVGVAVAALLAAPATWAAQTLGHATDGTFPTGGPANAAAIGGGGPGGGFGGLGRGGPRPGSGAGSAGQVPGGFAGPPPGANGFGAGSAGANGFGAGSAGANGFGAGSSRAGGFGGGSFGGGDATMTAAVRYAKAHGGGTIGVESQSGAAAAILSSDANVAGLGGFSGRESTVTVAWLSSEVRAGHLRWVLTDGSQGMRLPGDARQGSRTALEAVQKSCRAVSLSNGAGTIYDCRGRASAILHSAGSSGA
jgi:hypothetical protein